MATRRATKGGETIAGRTFKGGQFIPKEFIELERQLKGGGKGSRFSKLFTAKVEGLDSVIRKLKKLPERNRRHVMRPAVRKAATPVVRAARRLSPVGTGTTSDGRPREHLKKTITKTSVKWYRDSDTFLAVVGPEKNKSPHSHLVHDGTKPHPIALTQPLLFGSVVLPPGFVIQHPGSKANPFLSNAVEATRGQVQGILRKEILAGIEKQTNKLRSQR